MDVLRDKEGHSNIRLIILVFVVLTGIVAALLYFPPILTRTEEKRTSGDITFTDGMGNLLSGTLTGSVAGTSLEPANAYDVRWENLPNAGIYFDALATKSLAVNFRISGDSHNGKVMLENYAIGIPNSVNTTPPGILVKYVEINATGVSFSEAEISIKYTNEELNGVNESSLVIYRYDNATQTWSALATRIDANNNIASATVNRLSVFAIVVPSPELKIRVVDSNGSPINATIGIYENNSIVKSYPNVNMVITSIASGVIYPLLDFFLPVARAEPGNPQKIKVDALKTKNVAVELNNYTESVTGGALVILDDYGKNNPVSVPLPGIAVKFVEIGAKNISFSSANITIRYTDADLNGGSEDALTIYHWNGASWDAVPTTIDKVNKTLSASTASLSFWGVATLYQKALRCDTGTSIGVSDTTDTNCATASYTVFSTGLLLDPAGTTGGYIQFAAFSGRSLYGYFVDNTAYSTDVNITGVNGSMSMRLAATGITAYGMYQVGYYNPNGAADNFVGLFNSTETSGVTTTTITSYPVSFYAANKSAIIPANMKLAIRVWMRTSASGQPRFYLYRTTANYGSSVNYTIASPNASISGYITNKSSGLPLSGATVQTNTSLTTTTNANGFYNFTGLSNGTYMINASLTNYATNSTNVTVSGADVTNANISLAPLPTYLLSGYVTNASNGAAISGATVTTNTSQTTTTNATGYYNFTLSNGTYLITASNTSYDSNSTTITINGAAVGNVNITLTPTPPVSGKILVATNRYVILDDPNTGLGGADTVDGFAVPSGTGIWLTNSWRGKNTTIGMYALYMDKTGTPVNNTNITFYLAFPNGTVYKTLYNTTNSRGLANVSYDMSGTQFYGRWKVRAGNGSINSTNTTFIYNWWGCQFSSALCSYHNTNTNFEPDDGITYTYANSPYTNGRDRLTQRTSEHTTHTSAGWSNSYCTHCHQSYDNKSGGPNQANFNNTPGDVHRNISCTDSRCHGSYTTHATSTSVGNQLVLSCYNGTGGCHGNGTNWDRKDISNKSTLNSSNVQSALSLYSINSTSFNATFHTPNSTVPCIICHGPMHNISKPDPLTGSRNTITEDSQCKTCHTSYTEHNSINVTSSGVNCTLCHSDDVHDIQVFAQNATYVDLNHDNPNPARGNCTNCHQNATFFAALEAQPKAGNYTGRDPPIVAFPLEHSNDSTAGAKWKQAYWTNSDQLSWCIYCHSNTTHSAVALGRPANWDGNNIVNSSLTSNTTWCSGCHWQGYANGSNTYNDMVNAFTGAGLLAPPEISGNSTYGANTSIYEYTNHSLYTSYYPNLNDSACNRCHGYKYGFTRITQLVHNQSRVGGANCVDCHDIGGIALVARVNVTAANDTSAIHKNLNINASGTNSSAYYNNSKRCWACHSNGSEPSTPNAHPTSYKMPENCTDCHIQSATQNFNYTPNNTLLNVSEHYWNATEIHTPAVATCYACHNKSEMLIAASDPDAGSGAVYGGTNGGNNSTSHYGKKRADLRIGVSANCTYCHQNESTAFSTAMLDPAYNKSINNHSQRYNSSNPGCTSSQCHNSGWIHNSTLTRPALTLPNSTFCFSCHGNNGTGGTNYSGAVTGVREKHNNTVQCTECHLNTSKSIHPVRYLQSDATYNTDNSTGVNCVTCHQTNSVDSRVSRPPPKIPNPMHHSDNASNGTLWNSTGYWTNNTITSCTYCHNDTKHNATALGRPAYWKGDNVVNSSITSASNWCAGCHWRGYSSDAKSYNDMTSAFTTANLPVPPEITNGTYAPYNFSRYYNHSLTNYTDAACKPCHGINLTSGKITAFVHNITWGSCTDCHYSFSAMNITTRPDRYVNSTMFNASPHGGVACSNCHTKGHKNIGARKACEDCHAYQQNPLTDRNRHNITGAPGSGVVTNTDCTSCHDATLYNNAINNYGYNKTRDCDYCHTYPDKTYS